MKDPKFGKNKIQSFIEFDTPDGRLRFGEESKRLFIEINETKTYLTDSSGNVTATIAEAAAAAGVTIDGVLLKDAGISLTPTVVEYTKIINIPTTQIVGTDAGDLGHADGVPLVAAAGAGYAHEFVSAVLIYDFDTAAYTGAGSDDLVIRVGTVSVSPVIADADLLLAAADQIVHVRALAAADYDLPANAAINLKSSAVTNPGTAAGVIRVHLTYRVHTTGL